MPQSSAALRPTSWSFPGIFTATLPAICQLCEAETATPETGLLENLQSLFPAFPHRALAADTHFARHPSLPEPGGAAGVREGSLASALARARLGLAVLASAPALVPRDSGRGCPVRFRRGAESS